MHQDFAHPAGLIMLFLTPMVMSLKMSQLCLVAKMMHSVFWSFIFSLLLSIQSLTSAKQLSMQMSKSHRAAGFLQGSR
jgi:hypothetical protein